MPFKNKCYLCKLKYTVKKNWRGNSIEILLITIVWSWFFRKKNNCRNFEYFFIIEPSIIKFHYQFKFVFKTLKNRFTASLQYVEKFTLDSTSRHVNNTQATLIVSPGVNKIRCYNYNIYFTFTLLYLIYIILANIVVIYLSILFIWNELWNNAQLHVTKSRI